MRSSDVAEEQRALCLVWFWRASMCVSSGSLVGQMCGKGFLDDVRQFVCLFLFSACESDFTLHKPGAHTSTAWRWHTSFCKGLSTSHLLILSNFISPFRASLRIGSQRDITAIAFEDFILPFIQPVFWPILPELDTAECCATIDRHRSRPYSLPPHAVRWPQKINISRFPGGVQDWGRQLPLLPHAA